MRVSIIKEHKIKDLILKDEVEGSFWISDTDSNGIERNLMLIEADNNKWKLVSNKKVYCIQNNEIKKDIYLEYGCFYLIKNEMENQYFQLFCSPVVSQYSYYDVSDLLVHGVTIGSDTNSIIRFDFLEPQAFLFRKINNRIYLYDNGSKYGVYVNNIRVRNYIEIKNGDILFIAGLKIMYTFLSNNNLINHYLCITDFNNKSVKINMNLAASMPLPVNSNFEPATEITTYPLYDEKEYFHKIPRFVKQVENFVFNVDAPPSKQEPQDLPFILVIGPMLTMSVVSLTMTMSAVSNILNGNSTWISSLPTLISSAAMLLGTLLWPMLTQKYQKKQQQRKEKKRQKLYGKYLDECRKKIKLEQQEQSRILTDNYPDINRIVSMINSRDISLWQRKKQDGDYLTVSLGNATYEMKIDFNYPESHFELEEDNLKEMVENLGKEPKLLENVPYVYSYVENYISAIVGDETLVGEYAKRIVLQLLSFHSYDDLKIVILTDNENEYKWKFLKTIPYMFSNDREIRFYAVDSDEQKDLTFVLDHLFVAQLEGISNANEITPDLFESNYLVITDCFKKVRNLDFIKHILETENYAGFHLMILDNQMIHLPDQCHSYIELRNNKGYLYNTDNLSKVIELNIDFTLDINYEQMMFILSNIPIEIENTVEGNIPERLGFLEMFGVGKVEQLNVSNRWKLNDPTKSLKAAIGYDKQENIIYLDLHEKYHGPHGLIAGTTGSGKSEFIITYILSMAVNYSPEEVSFILIDYKGGGLAGAFENKKNGIRLPHLSGTITNLDKNEMNRTLVSIQSELTRRQKVFNDARDSLGESTIDIYKYQKFYRDGKLTSPMPHLFIICDEFAELKDQQPDFMDNLISAARIGRSLGVHLILATQKPSGVVNDQIWSNTKFRVCLKVATSEDSREMIKCDDAASIKNAGRFILQVGSNEVFVLGQSGYCGGSYIPSEIVTKELDTSVQFIDNLGNIIKSKDDEVEVVEQIEDLGDELSNILKHLIYVADNQNVSSDNLWLDAIKPNISLEYLINKYHFSEVNPTAIIGEYDDPSSQEQNILTLSLDNNCNSIVYGMTGNNREMFLQTFIFSICQNYSSQDVNFYIFDFGSESFRIFSKLPHVGDVIFSTESEKIDKMFKMIDEEIVERKKILADYNGDYDNYLKAGMHKLPRLIIIFNNIESFKEMYEIYDDILPTQVREGSRYGINYILSTTTSAGLFNKLLKNFSNIFVLDMNNTDEYTDLLGKIGNVYPADVPGRGLFKKEIAYEYQVAKICEDENLVNFIKEQATLLSEKNNYKAKSVPVLPDNVTFELLSSTNTSLKQMPIGMEKETLNPVLINLVTNKGTIISSNEIESCISITNTLLSSFRKMNNVVSVLFDLDEIFNSLKPIANSYCSQDADTFIDQIIEYYNTKIKNTDYNMVIIIGGANKFHNEVSDEKRTIFSDIVKENDNCMSIIIDSDYGFKDISFESWYTGIANTSSGVWIGEGVADQSAIKTSDYSKKYSESISSDYAWMIKNGKGNLIKLMSEITDDKDK